LFVLRPGVGLVQPVDRRKDGSVAADDFVNVFLFPAHDFRDLTIRQASDSEPGRRGAAEVVEVQIPVTHACVDLRAVRRGQKKCLMSGAELVRLPCPMKGDRRGQS
jgi:hypothetical protein